MFFALALEYCGGYRNLELIYESHPQTRLLIPLWCYVKPSQ